MHGGAGQPQLHHRAEILDEAGIRGAAAGGEYGDVPVTLATVSLTSWVNFPGVVRKDTPLIWASPRCRSRFPCHAVAAVLHPVDQAFRRVLVIEADVERPAPRPESHW